LFKNIVIFIFYYLEKIISITSQWHKIMWFHNDIFFSFISSLQFSNSDNKSVGIICPSLMANVNKKHKGSGHLFISMLKHLSLSCNWQSVVAYYFLVYRFSSPKLTTHCLHHIKKNSSLNCEEQVRVMLCF
jgi:hypothetical protein